MNGVAKPPLGKVAPNLWKGWLFKGGGRVAPPASDEVATPAKLVAVESEAF
jgi:hypothetical protein